MPQSTKATVECRLPFCEQDIAVTIVGTYHPYVRAYTPRGEYAPIDPPEPATFEYQSVGWYDPKQGKIVDITALIPPDAEQFVSDLAQEAFEELMQDAGL